jgi:hypothetical protein
MCNRENRRTEAVNSFSIFSTKRVNTPFVSWCVKGPVGADGTPSRLQSEAHTQINPLAGGVCPMLVQQHHPGDNVMSTGPDDQIKHPDSLTGTSGADTPNAPIVGYDSDVQDDPALRGQDEAGPVDEDA